MDEESQRLPIIRLTSTANEDLAGIDNVTAAMWGQLQAERYLAFLEGLFNTIAHNPLIGTQVDDYPGIRVYSAKIVKSRKAFGHRIFYREIDGGIRIVRILHMAMNWEDHLYDPPNN
jgi:toxin ParE1/3/4